MRIAVHDYAGHPFQFELSRALASRGHVVRHFFFADDPGPKGASSVSADDPQGLSIEPISFGKPYRKDKLVRRAVADLAYGRTAYRRIKAFRPDVVISGNTPLGAQRAIKQAAAACGARFVFWVQDFLGIGIEQRLAGRWHGLGTLIAHYFKTLEARLLEASDSIVLISPDFRRYLPKSVAGSDRVSVIRNWGALKSISPQAKRNGWAARHQLTDKLVVMYTGTLGLKHDPNLILQLCDAFEDDAEVAIVVCAAGINADQLHALNAARPRRNLRLLPLQPAQDMAEVLGTADVLVAILEGDAAEFSVPSKLLSYLCAGRSILLSAPQENLATHVLEESGGGISVDALVPSNLVAAAQRLRQDHGLRRGMGAAGRAYAERHFAIEEIASRFEQAFGLAPQPLPAVPASVQPLPAKQTVMSRA